MTPLVQVKLGAKWEEAPGKEHKAGATVTVDAVRGAWLLENIAQSRIVVEAEEPKPPLSQEPDPAIEAEEEYDLNIEVEPEPRKRGKR